MTTPIAPDIRLAAGSTERDAALALRHRVFCEEQGVALDLERAAGARRIALHAQAHARALYVRGGFAARGEVFEEADIEHVLMEKLLA
jgi:hypothetical protein